MWTFLFRDRSFVHVQSLTIQKDSLNYCWASNYSHNFKIYRSLIQPVIVAIVVSENVLILLPHFVNRRLTRNECDGDATDGESREFDQWRTRRSGLDGRRHHIFHEDSWRDCGSTSIPRQRPSWKIGHGSVLSRWSARNWGGQLSAW